jgi:hypothetical protein
MPVPPDNLSPFQLKRWVRDYTAHLRTHTGLSFEDAADILVNTVAEDLAGDPPRQAEVLGRVFPALGEVHTYEGKQWRRLAELIGPGRTLREAVEAGDIPPALQAFLRHYAAEHGRPPQERG